MTTRLRTPGVLRHSVRLLSGYAFAAPICLFFRCTAALFGRERALRISGAIVTGISRRFIGLAVPRIGAPDQFGSFRNQIRKNFLGFGLLYDIEVKRDETDLIEFAIHNCPFTSALRKLGRSDLCPFACVGDFAVVKLNRRLWDFRRTHSLGTDGQCCNHTYMRKSEDGTGAVP